MIRHFIQRRHQTTRTRTSQNQSLCSRRHHSDTHFSRSVSARKESTRTRTSEDWSPFQTKLSKHVLQRISHAAGFRGDVHGTCSSSTERHSSSKLPLLLEPSDYFPCLPLQMCPTGSSSGGWREREGLGARDVASKYRHISECFVGQQAGSAA